MLIKWFYLMVFASFVLLDLAGRSGVGVAEVIRGYPCIKRYNQLYCPTPGQTYPKDRINVFIDENKALIRRMSGHFQVNPAELYAQPGEFAPAPMSIDGTMRSRRADDSGSKVDTCNSTVEIVTPYWASNSAGKVRAIVNTEHFEQAIQQEVCQNSQTTLCLQTCGCEQKYKWHRLLAYDPDSDCQGIFMDWFLFPSCCVCRCSRSSSLGSFG